MKILACNDARERLARLLLHLARPKTLAGTQQREEAVLGVTHSDIAAMAALSRPHVSVLMNEFRARRLVWYHRTGPLRVVTFENATSRGRVRGLIARHHIHREVLGCRIFYGSSASGVDASDAVCAPHPLQARAAAITTWVSSLAAAGTTLSAW